jgi:PAS domain S-box-containing protein
MRMLAQTITSMNESVVITDLANTILSVNPAFLKTYGYQEREVLGKKVDILRPGADGARLPESVASAIAAGEWTGELMNVRRNGEVFPILLSTSVVRDDAGTAIALVGISRDITEQRRLQERLNEAERRRSTDLRRFAVSVQRAQEEERARISRELHDDLCQRLSGMKFRVEVLEDEARPISQKVNRQLRDFRVELDKTISEVRRVSSNLRPSVLDDFGLVVALKLLCKDFGKLHGIRTMSYLGNGEPLRANANIEIALYRIAQEALSNIAKHAEASNVVLHLLHRDSSICLIVEDDGKGFNQDDAAKAKTAGRGLGLISMRERAELLGGSLDISSTSARGTTISVTIPLREVHEEDQNPHR